MLAAGVNALAGASVISGCPQSLGGCRRGPECPSTILRVDQRTNAVKDPESRLPLAGLSGLATIIFSFGGFGLIGAAGFAVQEGTIEEVTEIVSKLRLGRFC